MTISVVAVVVIINIIITTSRISWWTLIAEKASIKREDFNAMSKCFCFLVRTGEYEQVGILDDFVVRAHVVAELVVTGKKETDDV